MKPKKASVVTVAINCRHRPGSVCSLVNLHMADPTTAAGGPKTTRYRVRLITGVGGFAVVYTAMMVNLLAGNDIPSDAARAMAAAGSACAVCVALMAGLNMLISSPKLKSLCMVLQYIFACLSICVLDCQFATTLTDTVEITYDLPAYCGCFVLITMLPSAYQQDILPIVLTGTFINVICFAFQISSYESPQPLLSAFIFQAGIILLTLRFTTPHPGIKYSSIGDISKTVTNENHEEVAMSSEIEAILNRLQKVHANAEEAVMTAKSEEDRLRANESEALVRDLLIRLKTKNLYEVSPDRLLQNLDQEEKVYLEENYLPQPVPKMTRRDRTRSSKFHAVPDTLNYTGSELAPMLTQIGKQWNFDTDFLTSCSNGHPVLTLGEYLFNRLRLNHRLNFDPMKIEQFFEELEEKYLPNSYHNPTHAADVMFSIHFLCKSTGLLLYSSDLELAGCVVATLGHDVGHLGFNNRYLVNSQHDLALECM